MRVLIAAASLALVSCASAPAPVAAPACSVSAQDRAWIDASLEAWRFTAREITEAPSPPVIDVVFFDDGCVLRSSDAFSGAAADAVWSATPHAGQVPLPGGDAMPPSVASFASADEGRPFFVMSTPSVWRAAGVSNEALGLEAMMTAVLIHEVSHVAQTSGYGARLTALIASNNLPDEFNDNVVQERFGDNAAFAASVSRETELFFQAALAPDDATARRLASEARRMMHERQARWYTGADAYFTEAENVWLTFEGSGQWVGYQWLVHPSGGGAESEAAMRSFARRGRQWSQTEGVALAFAVSRLAQSDWKREAFGGGSATLVEMLDRALAAAPG